MEGIRDISNSDDVKVFVARFYADITTHPALGPFFTGLDLEEHLPRIRAFWEMILFGNTGYGTNVMEVHALLHAQHPITTEHFQLWLMAFERTMRSLFAGPKADEAIQRARAIAEVMRFKLNATAR
ncbi:MAG: group III truncated hemoglobin [Flavobacteriales bacterium]|nr:group III truncated hemoglobin [Flavobacteriales bacterium]